MRVAEIIADDPEFVKYWTREAFRQHYDRNILQPPKTYLQISANPYDRAIALPAFVRGTNGIAGIKWIGSHSENVHRGLERASAIIILNDPCTMYPIAIIDGSLISTMRTFAVSLLMIDRFLDSNESFTVGIIGMGRLGRLHAQLLHRLYNRIEKVFCFSLTAYFDDVLVGSVVTKETNLKHLLLKSDVVITTTNAVVPYIFPDMLSRKTRLIINLSLMDFSLESILANEHLIVDDWEQNIRAQKVFKEGVDRQLIERDNVKEIGEVLFGGPHTYGGRIFVNPLGMGIEDIILAKAIYDVIIATDGMVANAILGNQSEGL